MHYREKLNIIFMRDNGPRHSFKLRRSTFLLLASLFACLPFLCVLLLAECWHLLQENHTARASIDRLEVELQSLETRAERLENLEALLEEDRISGRETVIRQLASAAGDSAPKPAPMLDDEDAPEIAEGPGHEEFPALDSGRVKVSNVQVRALNNKSLRIGLDLHNPDQEPILSGKVETILVTSDGDRKPLTFLQEDTGTFRISRFKRTVMQAPVPGGANIENSQLIIEVKDNNDKPLYRNIYSVQR